MEISIQYIENAGVDYLKWDRCIANSIQGNLYANSWYLDIVNERWDALVLNDYEAVMPVTKEKKYGFNMLVQPWFTQQLGIFSQGSLTEDVFSAFIKAIPHKYRYILLNLNKYIHFIPPGFQIKTNHNFELDLIESYRQIVTKFNENTRRNILKATQAGVCVSAGKCTAEQFMVLLHENVEVKAGKIPGEKYNDIKKIVQFCHHRRIGEFYSAYSRENTLLASVFFVFSNNKAVYLFAASTDEGREKRAMFALVDAFIQQYSEKYMTLDFEGSNVEGVARFYKGFGATDCRYLTLSKNRLPVPFRWLKK